MTSTENLAEKDILGSLMISHHKCDICGHKDYTAYIPQIDKWYCSSCLREMSRILEATKMQQQK